MYSMRFYPTESEQRIYLFLYLFLLRHVDVIHSLDTAHVPICIHKYDRQYIISFRHGYSAVIFPGSSCRIGSVPRVIRTAALRHIDINGLRRKILTAVRCDLRHAELIMFFHSQFLRDNRTVIAFLIACGCLQRISARGKTDRRIIKCAVRNWR